VESLVSVIVGGVIAGALAWFTEVGAWSLAAGAAITMALWITRTRTASAFRLMVGYGLAFLITWPFLVYGMGFVRYLITGEALGE
jgi:hypothetical protein